MSGSINAPRNPLASSFVAPHELEGLDKQERKELRAERKLDAQVSRMEKDALSTLVKKAGDVPTETFIKRMYVDKRTGQLELSSNALSHFLRKLTGHTTNADALKLGIIKEYGDDKGIDALNHLIEKSGTDGDPATLKDAHDILEQFTGVQVADFDEDAEQQARIWAYHQRSSPEEGSVASAASLDIEPGASPLEQAGEEPSLEAKPAASIAGEENQPVPGTMIRKPGQNVNSPLEVKAEANYDFKGAHRSSFAE